MASVAHRESRASEVRQVPCPATSSPDLSSPPKSRGSSPLATIYVADSRRGSINAGGEKGQAQAQTQVQLQAQAKDHLSPPATSTSHTKKPRKKREPSATATATATGNNSSTTDVKEKEKEKEKKPRKTRVSKDKTDPAHAPKKRIKTDKTQDASVSAVKSIASLPPGQSLITDMVGHAQDLQASAISQNRNHEAIANNPGHGLSVSTAATLNTAPDATSQRSIGQSYDPVRSSTMEPPSTAHNPFGAPQTSPQKSANRASASPSISSLIDPPEAPATNHIPFSPTPQSSSLNYAPTKNLLEAQISPSATYPAHPPTSDPKEIPPKPEPPSEMEVDSEPPAAKPIQTAPTSNSTGPNSKAASPKPGSRTTKEKDGPPRLPPGNGLLSSALFGGPTDALEAPSQSAPTVVLHVPLNGNSNQYVNFARMAEERYGFNALHPRLAAQRERLARVAAAGAALENAGKEKGSSAGLSGDEMSVELSDGDDRDGGGNLSNVEMGGMGGGIRDENGVGGVGGVDIGVTSSSGWKVEAKPAGPKKRKMKEDQYDKDDPFVDDTEMAWEEQAAASKDGFFVYAGPLVQEGEKPAVERADGTVKRGRGRGRGGSTRGTTSTSTRGGAGAGGAGAGAGAGGGSGAGAGGSGPGGASSTTAAHNGDKPISTRGQMTNRKPRVTKAARLLMEQEKVEREKMAVLAARPEGYPV